ncbi:MAG TPA: hypothetical protein VFX03_13155 [Thermomicrobiales bacterium]|nr:hypothetical protein [Thermomicrobiales bacterium]
MKIVQFLAIVLTAVALIPEGAHFFERFAKMNLAPDQYMTVQQIYQGWALFGVVLFGALAANLALAILSRGQRGPLLLASAAFVLVAATLVIFFAWTFPANQATANWTVAPENLNPLRAQWEYSHAVNAVLTFIAFLCVTIASLSWSE